MNGRLIGLAADLGRTPFEPSDDDRRAYLEDLQPRAMLFLRGAESATAQAVAFLSRVLRTGSGAEALIVRALRRAPELPVRSGRDVRTGPGSSRG